MIMNDKGIIETRKINGRASTLSSPRCLLRSLIRSAPRPPYVGAELRSDRFVALRARRTATSGPPNKTLERSSLHLHHPSSVARRLVPPLNSHVMNKRNEGVSMLKRLSVFCLFLGLIIPSVTFAVDFKYKKVDDFKTLESFKSIDEFESSYNKYIEECLDNTGGGTSGIECLIGYELWDRELNIYYNKLMKVLGEKERELLKESQLAWIKERDNSIAFNSRLLDNKYRNETGTMYSLMRAGDADEMMIPIVKQRALLLKKWFEFVKKTKHNK